MEYQGRFPVWIISTGANGFYVTVHTPNSRGTTVQTPDLLKWRLRSSLQPEETCLFRFQPKDLMLILPSSSKVSDNMLTPKHIQWPFSSHQKNFAKLKRSVTSLKLQDENWPFYNSSQNNSKQSTHASVAAVLQDSGAAVNDLQPLKSLYSIIPKFSCEGVQTSRLSAPGLANSVSCSQPPPCPHRQHVSAPSQLLWNQPLLWGAGSHW